MFAISGNEKKIVASQEQSYNVFYVFNCIQLSEAVIILNSEPAIIDISTKQGAEHDKDNIKAVSVEQYVIYCVKSYKNLGMFLVML